MKPFTEIRLQLRANGYSPIPVLAKEKRPMFGGWQNLLNTTPEQILEWEAKYWDHTNTGILTKYTPCLDLDINDEKIVDHFMQFIRGMVGDRGVLLRRIGQAPKCAVFFRTDQPFPKITQNLIGPDGREHRIEFLCDGQQVVVHGIHPGTGRPYEWPDGQDLCDVPRDALPTPVKLR